MILRDAGAVAVDIVRANGFEMAVEKVFRKAFEKASMIAKPATRTVNVFAVRKDELVEAVGCWLFDVSVIESEKSALLGAQTPLYTYWSGAG